MPGLLDFPKRSAMVSAIVYWGSQMESRSRLARIHAYMARCHAGHTAHTAALNLCAQAGRYYMSRQMRVVRLEAAQEAKRLAGAL